MNQVSRTRRLVDLLDEELSTQAFHLPDAGSAARYALRRGLEFAAEKLGLDGEPAVEFELRQGNGLAFQYTSYGLARQLAETLGALDDTVRAVYIFDEELTANDLVFGERGPTLAAHLIVLVDRKTQALAALVAGLDRALAAECADLLGTERLAHVLDVQTVDPAEVQNRRGYAALLSSVHYQPIQLWQR